MNKNNKILPVDNWLANLVNTSHECCELDQYARLVIYNSILCHHKDIFFIQDILGKETHIFKGVLKAILMNANFKLPFLKKTTLFHLN